MTAPKFELTSQRQKVSGLPTEPPGRLAVRGLFVLYFSVYCCILLTNFYIFILSSWARLFFGGGGGSSLANRTSSFWIHVSVGVALGAHHGVSVWC